MKSIYAFAFFVSMVSMCVFPVSSYAQDSVNFSIGKTPYRVSLAADAGVLLGQAEEIVYKYAGKDTYYSQLLWDLKPLVYLGSVLSLSRADPLAALGGAADLSVKFGLPILSGTMEDRDWLNNSNEDLLTNFSTHDAYIQGAMLLDVSGGITIPIAHTLAIKALVSFSYMRFSWIAQDGYTQYDMTNGWNSSTQKEYLQGTGITYDLNWLIFSPGFGLIWPFHRAFGLDFRFFISPLVFAWDVDTHLVTGAARPSPLQFSDTMRGKLYLEPALDLAFSPTNFLSLVLHGAWRYITGARGDTSETVVGTLSSTPPTVSKDLAGASYNAFDVGISIKAALPLGGLSKKK